MSNPSTPPSSPRSQKGTEPEILTPGRKVHALLAQFDDSDSDRSQPQRVTESTEQYNTQPEPRQHPTNTTFVHQPGSSLSGEDEDEDDTPPFVPRGRLAARLEAQEANGTADEDLPLALAGDDKNEQNNPSPMQTALTRLEDPDRSSDDELSRPAPKRRLLLKRKRSTFSAGANSARSTKSHSPLFFPSPSVARKPSEADIANTNSDTDELPENPLTEGKNKFLALVEKHRKQRHAMEAAEIAKRAVRVEQLEGVSNKSRNQRGSSPVDDSDEDTDASEDGAGSRMTKQARPTRKASKKALEEMNRETQRMSRNMQLTHQAKTKKKITKESLLARFNFSLSGIAGADSVKPGTKTTSASSAATSDAEATKEHETPPTSPLMEEAHKKMTSVILPNALATHELVVPEEEIPSHIQDVLSKPIMTVDSGEGRPLEGELSLPEQPQEVKSVRPIRVKWTREDAVMARGADSDSDLEIITSQAKTRKFAIFEAMPKRKALEARSHLMLRSLAHLSGNNTIDKKRASMNAAEMDFLLRKAARMQANLERQEKIEELKAKGVIIQTAEERERDQQEVEDLVERARQEAVEIHKREKDAAKKDGTFVRDSLDDDEDDEDDGDFEQETGAASGTEDELIAEDDEEEEDSEDVEEDQPDEEEEEEEDEDKEEGGGVDLENENGSLVDDVADEQASDGDMEAEQDGLLVEDLIPQEEPTAAVRVTYKARFNRVIVDDEDENEAGTTGGTLPALAKTPQHLPRSARKFIPGLQMSDDLSMGLTQAFAATMADSQSQQTSPESQEQDTLAMTRDLPSPSLLFAPQLNRLDSIDMVSDSQPASQIQPLNLDVTFDQEAQSPAKGFDMTGTPISQFQMPFEPTQDVGYMLSPFLGSRFDTPMQQAPHSTLDTVVLPDMGVDSPLLQRKGRLRRGRATTEASDDLSIGPESTAHATAFEIMRKAAKQKIRESIFNKEKSNAKDIVDEAAEESEDEYAGLGGQSDDDVGEEDEADRQMIDHDTQVGVGDEAKLAGLFADRERQQDEAAVSKLLKDITTGALRRKRGAGGDLDLSDEEDEAARRREAKRREYAKMRRELFKDEAIEKISEDRKKEAFLKSIEDRDDMEGDENLSSEQEETEQRDSQSQQLQKEASQDSNNFTNQDFQHQAITSGGPKRKRPLENARESAINRLPPAFRRTAVKISVDRKPSTLAEIRDSVSFLIEEPDSQSATINFGLSDSEDEPEKYLDLDRHLKAADETEEEDDGGDLGDFVVDDSQGENGNSKKAEAAAAKRPSFTERRTKNHRVVDRLSLLRHASSSSNASTAGGKMAFFTSASASRDSQFGKATTLLRRATTNSSFGGMAGRDENVSATGVTVLKERGSVGEEKVFVRKGSGGQRNAVNYRVKPSESKMSARAGVKQAVAGKGATGKRGGFLGGLFQGDSWH